MKRQGAKRAKEEQWGCSLRAELGLPHGKGTIACNFAMGKSARWLISLAPWW
jgi:hypothetical protein